MGQDTDSSEGSTGKQGSTQNADSKHMSRCIISLKGCSIGDDIGSIIGVVKGDTRTVDYSSYRCFLADV